MITISFITGNTLQYEKRYYLYDMQDNNNDHHVHLLFTFAHVFYKGIGIIQEIKTENISIVLLL